MIIDIVGRSEVFTHWFLNAWPVLLEDAHPHPQYAVVWVSRLSTTIPQQRL